MHAGAGTKENTKEAGNRDYRSILGKTELIILKYRGKWQGSKAQRSLVNGRQKDKVLPGKRHDNSSYAGWVSVGKRGLCLGLYLVGGQQETAILGRKSRA